MIFNKGGIRMKKGDKICIAQVTCKGEECYQFVTNDFAKNHKKIPVYEFTFIKEHNSK